MKRYLLLLLAWGLLSGFNVPASGTGVCGTNECLDGDYDADSVDTHIDCTGASCHSTSAQTMEAIECSGGAINCTGTYMESGVAGSCPLNIRANSGDVSSDKLQDWQDANGAGVAHMTTAGMLVYTSIAASGSASLTCESYTQEVEGSYYLDLDGDNQCTSGFYVRDGAGGIVLGASETGGVSVYSQLNIPTAAVPTVDTEGDIGWDSDGDGLVGYDGTNKVVVAPVMKTLQFTALEPDGLAESSTLPFWENRTGFVYHITRISANSDIDNIPFTLKEVNNSCTDFTDLTTIEAVTITTNGTSVYYTTVEAENIDHTTIEHGNALIFDNSASDAAYLKVTIEGKLLP